MCNIKSRKLYSLKRIFGIRISTCITCRYLGNTEKLRHTVYLILPCAFKKKEDILGNMRPPFLDPAEARDFRKIGQLISFSDHSEAVQRITINFRELITRNHRISVQYAAEKVKLLRGRKMSGMPSRCAACDDYPL